MKKVLVLMLCSVTVALCVEAQTVASSNTANWSVTMGPVERFIENKSQFDGKGEQPRARILYGVDWGATQILFTNNGLEYRFEERKQIDKSEERKRERERMEKLQQGKSFTRPEDEEVEVEHDVVLMQWLGANPAARLTGVNETDDYFSYTIGKGDEVENIYPIKGYERLLYENLYPNIDVEYAFHPHGGIKYKIILHPGADASQIRMKYSGSEKIITDESGNLHIGTSLGDIIDHAPLSFYSKNEKRVVGSLFSVSGDIVSFELNDYKNSKEVTIDPWTVVPNLPTATKVYYIKADSSGNAYIYGGDSPHRLQKYTAAGAVAWTYNTPWTAAADNWFGALAVDLVGNSYITSGTEAIVSKINTNGGLEWTKASGGFLTITEYWAPAFNCDYTHLAIGGTYSANPLAFQFHGAAFDIDLSNGAVTQTVIVTNTLVSNPSVPFGINEIRAMCSSPNGNYYFLTLDTIGSLSPSLNINSMDSSSYNFSYYLPYGQSGGQGNNGIAATPYFIYTTDGQILIKWDINNYSILNRIIIPSGSRELCSGVAVDSCGNVYVGSVGKVIKYDANLNLVSSTNTPGEVYDVAVTKNGEVLACGHGFAMSIDFAACNPYKNLCIIPFPIEITSVDILCNGGCDGTATATPQGGTAPYSYAWSNGQTGQTATNLCAGNYLVTVTDATNAISVGSVTINEPTVFTIAVTSSSTTCGTVAITSPLTGSSPFSYEWSNGGTTPSISGLATGTYSATVIDGNNCSAFGSVNVVESPGFSVSAAVTNPTCGNCDGAAALTTTGGNPPYIYEWSTGDTMATVNGLCADIYYVTASENPSGSNSVFWSEDFSGGNSGWTLNTTGSGANGNFPNRWVINSTRDNTDCPICPTTGSGGNYLHVTCDSSSFFCTTMGGPSCVYSAGFIVFDNSTDKYAISPIISTIGKNSITLRFWYMSVGDMALDYGTVSLSNDGGNSWTPLPTQYSETPACTQAVINVPSIYENIPNFRIRFRWINNNDLNGNNPPFVVDDIELSAAEEPCSAITSIFLVSDSGPKITIDSIRNVSCKNASDGAILTTTTGGFPPYSYNWTNGATTENISGLTGGNYIVIVTDSADCVAIADTTITEPPAMTVTGTVSAAGCTSGGTVDISVSGGTLPYSYLWSNGATSQDISNVQSGAYQVTVTDINNCTKTSLFNVSSPAIFLTLDVTDASCGGVSDGSIITTLLGGTAPFQYSWSSGDTTTSLTAIPGGNYSLTVLDNSGCSAVQSATVESPAPLNMTASINKVQCKNASDGGIKVNPSGGIQPYFASWASGQTGLTLTALPTGTYTVTVTDSTGCTRDSAFVLTAVSVYTVEASSTAALCDGTPTGSIEASIISGTTPSYSYVWSTGDTTSSVSNVAPGAHTVTVTDALDCEETTTVEVQRGLIVEETVVPPCPNQANGAIIPRISGGVSPYEFVWNTGATTPTLVNIDAGIFSFTVTDQSDCIGSDTVIVMTDTSNVAFCDTIVFYEVFSPNGDGVNDEWVVDGVLRFPENDLQIFNRWGSVVFEAEPYNNDWDGTSKKGELLPSATYYFILKLNDGKESVYSGNITLIR